MGVLVARVTSDAEALARFAQWGMYSWTVNPALIVGILAVLAFYSWQLTLVVIPGLPAGPTDPGNWLQKRQIAAYDVFRTRVGEMLSSFSESVMGAAAIRAYGSQDRARQDAPGPPSTAATRPGWSTNRYMAGVFVVGDIFGSVA